MTQTTNLQQTIDNTLQECLNNSSPTSSPKSSILLWTNSHLPNSFILKKEGKRYLGLPRKDKKGENYWKFKEIGSARPIMDKKQENANNSNSSE